jgi:nicotinate phosphoribosyltransferase
MMAGYWREGRADREVCFEYFFRSLPPHAGFAVCAGLDPFLDYIEHLKFHDDDIAYLRSLNAFDDEFLDFLASFEPQCTIRAFPEGTLVFPHEPIIQVEGPIVEAQLIESALLNMLNYQTLIATKSARICLAAEGDPVMEFGLRRAHGPDGGLSGSRAAYIGGCTSSSNVLAGKVYGIPVAGTIAHSWVMSFPTELEAFRSFAYNNPETCTLLVDTYDTIGSGVPNAITVFNEMRESGLSFRPAIRLDSGDLAKLSKQAHAMLVDAGYEDPIIVASNDLEEDLIADLKRQDAKINAWGVGTHLITSRDCPSLSGVYKLVAIRDEGDWKPRIKITSNISKATSPGRKNLVRYYNAAGAPMGDVFYDHGETIPEQGSITVRDRVQSLANVDLGEAARSESLLIPVLKRGRRITKAPPISAIRQRAQEQIAMIPEEYKRLRNPEIYRILMSPYVADLRESMLKNPDRL